MTRQEEAKRFVMWWAEYNLALGSAVADAQKELVGDAAAHQQVGWIGQRILDDPVKRLELARQLATVELQIYLEHR